jgi:hypothetical protein
MCPCAPESILSASLSRPVSAESREYRLIFCTSSPEVALFVLNAGADRVFIDLEITGKAARQKNKSAVTGHSIDQIGPMAAVCADKLYIRVDGFGFEALEQAKKLHSHSGAGIIIPMFKRSDDLIIFKKISNNLKIVGLAETAAALENLESILDTGILKEVHVGLRDLAIDMGYNFLFELLLHPLVVRASLVCAQRGVPFYIGGIAPLGCGLIPPEVLLPVYFMLNSCGSFMSRDFGAAASDMAQLNDLGKKDNLKSAIEQIKNNYKKIISQVTDRPFADKISYLKSFKDNFSRYLQEIKNEELYKFRPAG